ncbi:MAG: respiratory nitrate reductase subunit gamma [Deltaproteobacteria bacterium]|nr:respiratory nitrate reductase subunit gamma [Deltaproteobacteria bacterium]
MVTLVYLAAYLGTIACVAIVALSVMNYLKKPQHVRWELYPVGHEAGPRVAYGGSYLEDVDWWKKKQESSFVNGLKALLMEALFLHATFEHNRSLWNRTYPFHCGLYLLLGGFFLTVFAALAQLMGIAPGACLTLVGNLVQVLSLLGCIGVTAGACALIHRRLNQENLRKYSMREHYVNLGAFAALGALGVLAWLSNPSFFELGRDFIANALRFQFVDPGSASFSLYLILGFALAAYVPATHMGHFYMKYFLYHDIRWGDQPAQDSEAAQQKIGTQLSYRVSWSASHIKGDGQKTWAEVATTNPTANPDGKN